MNEIPTAGEADAAMNAPFLLPVSLASVLGQSVPERPGRGSARRRPHHTADAVGRGCKGWR